MDLGDVPTISWSLALLMVLICYTGQSRVASELMRGAVLPGTITSSSHRIPTGIPKHLLLGPFWAL